MKIVTALLTLFLFVTTTFGQAEKTLVKSIPYEKGTVVNLALAGETATNEWENDYIRIIATIETTNTSETILKRLVAVGRYDINVEESEARVGLSVPKLATAVVIQGMPLEEKIRYEIWAPQGTELNIHKIHYDHIIQTSSESQVR